MRSARAGRASGYRPKPRTPQAGGARAGGGERSAGRWMTAAPPVHGASAAWLSGRRDAGAGPPASHWRRSPSLSSFAGTPRTAAAWAEDGGAPVNAGPPTLSAITLPAMALLTIPASSNCSARMQILRKAIVARAAGRGAAMTDASCAGFALRPCHRDAPTQSGKCSGTAKHRGQRPVRLDGDGNGSKRYIISFRHDACRTRQSGVCR